MLGPAPTLVGLRVRLEPLGLEHVEGLLRASNEGRDTYGWTVVASERDAMEQQVADLLALAARGEAMPFAQVAVADERVVGMTRYLTIREVAPHLAPFAVEIGGTWLAASVQRSAVNTESKLLLLDHAFTTWRCARVDLKTDARNERSRAAIERIGATLEGVLRQWQPSQVAGEEGLFRDTAMYSITFSEWPHVREELTKKLERRG